MDQEFVAPEFLTRGYIQNILQKFNRDTSIEVQEIQVRPFGGVGDAFASTMYRVAVQTKSQGEPLARHISLVVKMMPTLELAVDKLGSGSYDVHEKEMDMFQKVFPRLRKILKAVGEGENVFPKALAVDRIRGVLVLEDLAEKRFLMADRKVGLDLDHLKLGLIKLAQFHAASMVLLREEPSLSDRYDVGMLSRGTSAFHDFLGSNMDALIAEVSTWQGFKVFGAKLKELRSEVFEKANRVFDNEPGDLKALIHGDIWVNNLMFQYEKNGLPKDVILLDFQFSCFASPVIDLIYFLHTSSTADIMQTKILELTQFYYVQLKKILLKLKFNLNKFPTLHQFQLQVIKKYFYGFVSSMLILPLFLSDDDELNFENVHQTTAKSLALKRRLYQNTKLQQIIRNLLPHFDRLGLLDPM